MEIPDYSRKSFRAALTDALRAKRGNEFGDVNKDAFEREVETHCGGSPKAGTVRAYRLEKLPPTPAIMEAIAAVLELPQGPMYFLEYRQHQISEVLQRRPDLVDECLALCVDQDQAETHIETQTARKRSKSTG